MPKIKFLVDYTVKAVPEVKYAKDSVHTMPDASCAHFISRRVAVLVNESKAVETVAVREVPEKRRTITEP